MREELNKLKTNLETFSEGEVQNGSISSVDSDDLSVSCLLKMIMDGTDMELDVTLNEMFLRIVHLFLCSIFSNNRSHSFSSKLSTFPTNFH